jgi:lysophospholipase L1-like esterase
MLFSDTLFFTLGEVLARQFDIVDRINGFSRRFYIATDHPYLPYRLRPGFSTNTPSFSVRVNAFGLRGPATTAAPRGGWRRILVIGDSVVFGVRVQEAATFLALLQSELAARGQMQTEVLNGGVPGYNTEAELAFLRQYGLNVAPDQVLLGVSLNDIGDTPFLTASGILTSESRLRTQTPWLNNHSEFYTLLRWFISYMRGGHWFQRVTDKTPQATISDPNAMWAALNEAIARRHQEMYGTPAGAGWERIRQALQGLRDLTQGRGIGFAVVIFSEKFQVGTGNPNLSPQRAWLGLCEEFNLRCVDLWPAFAAATGNESLFSNTQHPSPAGDMVAARAVADFLTQ